MDNMTKLIFFLSENNATESFFIEIRLHAIRENLNKKRHWERVAEFDSIFKAITEAFNWKKTMKGYKFWESLAFKSK